MSGLLVVDSSLYLGAVFLAIVSAGLVRRKRYVEDVGQDLNSFFL
jgi:hypothetical protein